MDRKTLFNTELPIIQAPMAGVQDSALAIAVSEAGGLGSLPCAMLTAEGLEQQLEQIRKGTNKPVNLNFFCHKPPVIDQAADKAWIKLLTPYYKEFDLTPPASSGPPSRTPFNSALADIVCAFKPAVVSFHFGLPDCGLMEQLHGYGIKILSSATTVDEAIWLENKGVDGIIAQGLEAGGHRGMFLTEDLASQQNTLPLLDQILEVVKRPVIAAGGIATPEDVKHAINRGATAVQVGTSYLLCHETHTSQIHRNALKGDGETALTNLLSGRPARGIINRLMSEQGPISEKAPEFPLATAAIAPLRAKAEEGNNGDFSPLWSGSNREGCKEIPAAELTRELVSLL